jgi:hypothetical protein
MGMIGEPVKILWRLGLHIRIGPGQLPDAAEIVTSFKPENTVAAFVEGFGSRKAAHRRHQ